MSEIWAELRRRNVFRVAVAYAVMGWVLLQVASLIAPALGLPGWSFSFVLFVLIIGFPLALLFAWAFELTPEGLKRTGEVDRQASVTLQTGRKFDFLIIGVLSVALLFFVVDRLFMAPSDTSVAPQEVVRSSIAVLPFVNMSNDPDQVYFSDGISEEILNVLGQIPNLHVTSRSSAFRFRGEDIHIPTVAQQLGVANILEGSVRKSGTRIRITAQLIDASTDRHLWTNTYDRELTDIFTIQDEISKAIVDALYVHLGIEAPTTPKVKEANVEAWRLYLLGRHNFEQRTQDTLYKAIDFFDQAIAIDPGYAPAYAGKADTWMLLMQANYGDVPGSEALALAEPLIEKALELDPGLAEAYASKGLFLLDSGQYETSLKAFDRAIELNPNLARAWHWKGMLFRSSVEHSRALESWQRAYALDPLSPQIFNGLISNRVLFGQFSEAEELLERLQAMDPVGASPTTPNVTIDELRGNWAEVYLPIRRTFEEFPGDLSDWMLGFSELSLKAFDPEARHLFPVNSIAANSFNDPATAWQDYMALPRAKIDNIYLKANVVYGMARLGKYKEVIEVLESWPNFTETVPGSQFEGVFPISTTAPLLVLARQKIGDAAGARRVMAEIETYIQILKEQGATWTLSELEARVYALKGEDDAVIAALEQAHKDGYLTWYWLNTPFYDDVRDREDFQAIVRSVDAKVNVERAKLGWDPVE